MGSTMTDLPCCRLCNCNPCYMLKIGTDIRLSYCSNLDCPNSQGLYTDMQWRRLMRVPAKKPVPEPDYSGPVCQNEWEIAEAEGWNDCVDAMSKGE